MKSELTIGVARIAGTSQHLVSSIYGCCLICSRVVRETTPHLDCQGCVNNFVQNYVRCILWTTQLWCSLQWSPLALYITDQGHRRVETTEDGMYKPFVPKVSNISGSRHGIKLHAEDTRANGRAQPMFTYQHLVANPIGHFICVEFYMSMGSMQSSTYFSCTLTNSQLRTSLRCSVAQHL